MNSLNIDSKQYKWIYLYYIILHVICLSWTNTAMVQPAMPLRLGITAAIFIPLIKYFWLSPAVIILFVGLRFNSVSPFGYVPQTWNIYIWIVLIIAMLHSLLYKNKFVLKFSSKQLLLLIFVFAIDLINFKIFNTFLLFVLLLFILYNSIENRRSFNVAMLAFVLLTITLSIYYFVFAKEFASIHYGSDAERSVWVDPNYFGFLLGCGIVISGAFLFTTTIAEKLNIVYKVIFITCIVLGLITIILQASRGASLAIMVALLIEILFSKIKPIYKIIILLISSGFIVYLFNSGAFTLLVDRVLSDNTGSGRTIIWERKLNGWIEKPINLLGSGSQSVVYDFPPYEIDCHNEFISILINYGVIGLIVTIITSINLIRIRKKNAFIWSIVAFLFIGFMTLSPFTCQTGWIALPFLIMILYKYIQLDNKKLL